MYRFYMPEGCPDLQETIVLLKDQFQKFSESDPLKELCSLLRVDTRSIRQVYNGRLQADGHVIETQTMKPLQALEEHRKALYPLLSELGFFHINTPLKQGSHRILILGGSLNAGFKRVRFVAGSLSETAVSIDGLTCFRPINPTERKTAKDVSAADTEFGALQDAFIRVFGLSQENEKERFEGDRNLNRISCIRSFHSPGKDCVFRIFAAPSSQPESRRADTGDTLAFYLENAELSPEDSLLAITHNRYCNRQFLQLAFHLIKARRPFNLDVIGCMKDDEIVTESTYDPFQYLQDLISILDWIDRFNSQF